MAQAQNNVAAAGPAAGASAGGLATERPATRGRIVFLNALPLNALPRTPHLRLDILPVTINELAAWAQRRVAEGYEVVHYIRHPATIQALRAVGVPLSEQPNAGLYSYREGDILVVVTLRAPQRGQEVSQVNINDLEIWIVSVV
jgi:hypothetical protein